MLLLICQYAVNCSCSNKQAKLNKLSSKNCHKIDHILGQLHLSARKYYSIWLFGKFLASVQHTNVSKALIKQGRHPAR